MSKSNLSRAAIYARRASVLQGDTTQPEQVSHCLQHAQGMVWNVTATFIDDGVSCRSPNRSEFQKLCTAVRSGTIDIVLTQDWDRISRRHDDLFDFLSLCDRHAVILETLP